MESSQICNLEHENDWSYLLKSYKLKSKLGAGAQGSVILARHRMSRKIYAVKHLENVMQSKIKAKMAVRELQIMAKLSKIEKNVFTTKVHEVVIAGDPQTFSSIFIVMDYFEQDLSALI